MSRYASAATRAGSDLLQVRQRGNVSANVCLAEVVSPELFPFHASYSFHRQECMFFLFVGSPAEQAIVIDFRVCPASCGDANSI